MELRVFPAVGKGAFVVSPHLIAWLWSHVGQFDLLVIRKLFSPIGSLAGRIACHGDVPYVIVPHGTLSRYTFRYRRTVLKRVYYELVEKRTIAGATAIRFTSEAEYAEAPVSGPSADEWVIPHPYEPQYVGECMSARESGQVLFLSRFHPVKGLGVLLDAFDRVRTAMPETRLVLAGSGDPRFEREIKTSIGRLDLNDVVELPGFVEGRAKWDLLAESSIFVLPSEHENFGIAAVEAMDAGLPVVISREVAISSMVEHAGAGIVLEQRTPEGVASALLRLLRDAPLRRRLGRRGRRLVETAFDPTTVGPELVRLYSAAARRADTCEATESAQGCRE